MNKEQKTARIKWAVKQAEKMARQESDLKIKALLLRSAAAGYDRIAKNEN